MHGNARHHRTPFFQHSANYTGRAVKAMPPVYSAERVARTIVNCARWPRREVFVGNMARIAHQQSKVMPGITERSMALMTDKQHLYQDRTAAPTTGTLYQPMVGGSEVDRGWQGRRKTRSRRLVSAGTAALVGVVALRSARVGSSRT